MVWKRTRLGHLNGVVGHYIATVTQKCTECAVLTWVLHEWWTAKNNHMDATCAICVCETCDHAMVKCQRSICGQCFCRCSSLPSLLCGPMNLHLTSSIPQWVSEVLDQETWIQKCQKNGTCFQIPRISSEMSPQYARGKHAKNTAEKTFLKTKTTFRHSRLN